MSSDKPIVLLIDEVDQAGNHDSFIKFLGLLRSKYLMRDKYPSFQSIILAGVYDIKNLKLKVRDEIEKCGIPVTIFSISSQRRQTEW